MASYFQMGHDTENLISEIDLELFSGIILSPLNRIEELLVKNVQKFREQGDFDILVDPQLYFPRNAKSRLEEHRYFPDNYKTQDLTSEKEWKGTLEKLIEFLNIIKADRLCSPVIQPRIFNEEFYSMSVKISNLLVDQIGQDHYCTVLLNLENLEDVKEFVPHIASILDGTNCMGYYLIIDCKYKPRIEIPDNSCLKGLLYLIYLLKSTGRNVLVSHTSSDMLLYKYAGADSCATGKFFNLRRFTRERFEKKEEDDGGNQSDYWFEQNLLSFLRGDDVKRLQVLGLEHMLNKGYSNNYWSAKILDKIGTGTWRKESWRHFLAWFCKTENYFQDKANIHEIKTWIETAEDNWEELEEHGFRPIERKNNGKWLGNWRACIEDFDKIK